MAELLLFNVENQNLAFDINQIERVIWAVEVTSTPKSPSCLLGIINMHGVVIPVVNLRQLLGLPKREMKLSDQLLVCQIDGRTMALWIDGVRGMATVSNNEMSPGSEVFPDMKTIDFVIKNGDEMTLVYKWDELIPIAEVNHSIKVAT